MAPLWEQIDVVGSFYREAERDLRWARECRRRAARSAREGNLGLAGLLYRRALEWADQGEIATCQMLRVGRNLARLRELEQMAKPMVFYLGDAP